ncbi:hypothetical protein ETD86_32850 [Nonomuraea turkmeniaca]|uniref:Uncharacterized protein n=1 Tax=Nonomuraea turkmeniaca TaxID=103838 RepID=A0A5S4F7E2_9ACTN|nr:hypothetical protein [Nonomuraea turkmeniaca]TMR12372.1 hypothetical protein ETD86_32850 [Nonomuraea turkmeniaca]
MEHSPVSTRAYRSMLIGSEGLVVAVLRNGNVALLKLDGEWHDLPAGVRRWAVAWDDLAINDPACESEVTVQAYVAGFSKEGRVLRQHAVVPGTNVAICSSPVGPLPVCGWSLAFSPDVPQACAKCLALLDASDREDSTVAMPAP